MTTPAGEIRFTVYGEPQTAGSKRAFPFKRRNGQLGVAVSDDNPKSRDWKNAVASQARESMGDYPLSDSPLSVAFIFYRPRPKGHFGKHGLKRSAYGLHPTTRPDVLKLARAVEDALTGVVWRDDSQIVEEVLKKYWGEPARVEIVIREINGHVPQIP